MNQIVSIQIEKGRVHDLTIARKYVKEFTDTSCVMADLAYKGFKEIDGKLLIPIKKPRKRELTKEAKKINKEISRRRIPIEHINSKLKVFRILSERYRNRRKRFGLRMNLIAGLVNWMIKKRLTQEVYSTNINCMVKRFYSSSLLWWIFTVFISGLKVNNKIMIFE